MTDNGNRKGFIQRLLRAESRRFSFRRLLITVAVAALFFGLFKPCFIQGSSMEPTFRNNTFTLSFRLRYILKKPQRGDIVTIAWFGRRELLKRVVAVAGDTVEFRNGVLVINGEEQNEPYVKLPCNWSRAPVTVRDGYCFAVGDNRSQDMLEHVFGEIKLERITGGVLF